MKEYYENELYKAEHTIGNLHNQLRSCECNSERTAAAAFKQSIAEYHCYLAKLKLKIIEVAE